MRRWAKRIALGLLVLLAVLAAPIVWIEGACSASRDASVAPSKPLVADRGYVRRESDSYLSFPEWYIVYAYDDLAGVLRTGSESQFNYWRQITGFWQSLCGLNRVVTSRGGTGFDTKVMLYTIGWSFTAELGVKGAYEKTVGRFFEWTRRHSKTPEDAFAARDMQAYAAFLRQTPWYAYPFTSRVIAFWRETPLLGWHIARKIERRVIFTGEYGIKAAYGALIGFGSTTTMGLADLEIYTVVAGLEPGDLPRDGKVKVVRELGGGRTLIKTPRYQVYTDLLIDLARRGRNVAEIAGNQRILVTVLAPAKSATPPGATELFALAIQSKPDRRRVGLDVPVPRLAETIRTLERGGATVEHVYDY